MPLMSRKLSKEKYWVVFALVIYLGFFRSCRAVSLWQRGDVFDGENRDGDFEEARWPSGQQVNRNTNVGQSDVVAPDSADAEAASPYFNVSMLGESDFALINSSWTVGKSRRRGFSGPDSSHENQAVSTDFDGVQGKVHGRSFHSSPHRAKWLAMRPLVLCDDKVMTFTASGEGFTYLFVNREGGSLISLFQLPSYCGYTVKASGQSLEVIALYGACFMIQKNGSYILPLMWLGSPMKLSCPVQPATAAPSVFCSSSAMAVQVTGQEPNRRTMGVLVNGGWRPFISAECAHSVLSDPGFFVFLVPQTAPCVTTVNGLHLHFLLDDQDHILSCPTYLRFPLVQDPASPSPTSPQVAQFPGYPQNPHPGSQVPQLPQLFPPHHLTQVSPGSVAGQQQSLDLSGSAPNVQADSTDSGHHDSQHFPVLHYPQVNMPPPFVPSPFPSPPLVHPAQAGNNYGVIPLYLPAPDSSYYPYGPFLYLNSDFKEDPASTPQTPPSPSSSHHTRMPMPNQPNSPSYYFGHFYPQRPVYFPRFAPPPPATEQPHTGPQQPKRPHTCPPYPHMMCGVYPYPHYPLYPQYYPVQSQYPSAPQYTQTQPPETTKKPPTTTTTATTTTTTSTTMTSSTPTITTSTAEATLHTPDVHCKAYQIEALVPFADIDSFHVRVSRR
ncbi:uncharacterized protein LOC142897845 [Nelusetta ayraudi]|uniref:uncharacterized protein LOC142897845 n=1 Tax=Nelusetta ayraudi TaxID=303726 RepID=UPI003F6FD9E1